MKFSLFGHSAKPLMWDEFMFVKYRSLLQSKGFFYHVVIRFAKSLLDKKRVSNAMDENVRK